MTTRFIVIPAKHQGHIHHIMETLNKIMNTSRHQLLLDRLIVLRADITQRAILNLVPFTRYYMHGNYSPSATNLAHYLAFRQHDLREIQQELTTLGLSSLGRGEANIVENIDKVISLLMQITKNIATDERYDSFSEIKIDGNEVLAYHTDKLLGTSRNSRRVRIMVTLPTQAAIDYALVHSLIKAGMDCARINCVHDNRQIWLAMIQHIHQAEKATGKSCRIMMDIAGQKIRTGPIEAAPAVYHIKVKKNEYGTVITPGKLLILPSNAFDLKVAEQVSHLFRIAIDEKQHASLQAGDHLEFIDARGKKRILEILPGEQENVLFGLCWQSSYISLDTEFKLAILNNAKNKQLQQKIAIKSLQLFPVKIKVFSGDQVLLTRSNIPGRPAIINQAGIVVRPASISISHDDILNLVTPGNPVWIDDGKIGAIVTSITDEGLVLTVNHTPPKGAVIRSDKGLNFPDTELNLSPLTHKDLEDLDFIVEHADMVAYSFVQSKEDMSFLLNELLKRDAAHLPVIAKIETNKAVKNLPDIILSTIGRTQLGVMIARGDLAVELGSIRMAEIQEEILWICEAAHVPVIWATQVLESLAKNGIQSRPEITDAAMSVRAECVMLNKGPYILNALNVLDNILKRM